jgi:hypothetical protein
MAPDESPRAGPKFWQTACKPNSVEDGHSSRRRIAARAPQRPTRGSWRAGPVRRHGLRRSIPAYLVLLRVGFTLPSTLQPKRCALTAPFHPYPAFANRAVCFLWHLPSRSLDAPVPDVIRHTALRSSDFPLPASLAAHRQRPSSRLPASIVLQQIPQSPGAARARDADYKSLPSRCSLYAVQLRREHSSISPWSKPLSPT